jgi:hypothetical protein
VTTLISQSISVISVLGHFLSDFFISHHAQQSVQSVIFMYLLYCRHNVGFGAVALGACKNGILLLCYYNTVRLRFRPKMVSSPALWIIFIPCKCFHKSPTIEAFASLS